MVNPATMVILCLQGFKEFYNQRRRWMPSTLLNIADLIGDYKQVNSSPWYTFCKQVVEKNDDISFMYILYQGMMMVGTLIGMVTSIFKN